MAEKAPKSRAPQPDKEAVVAGLEEEIQKLELKEETRQNKRAALAQDQNSLGTVSIMQVVEQEPKKFKSTVDALFVRPRGSVGNRENEKKLSEEDFESLRAVFLYFFELSGLRSHKDQASEEILDKMLDLVVQVKGDPNAKLETLLKKEQEFMLGCVTKNYLILAQNQIETGDGKHASASEHKKCFKRFVKLLVKNLIELYPRRQQVLPLLVDRVVALTESKLRFLRLSFTQVAMHMLKVAISELQEVN